MIRQPPIIIQPTQIRPTNITHLQLLVTTRPRRVSQDLQLPALLLLLPPPPLDPPQTLQRRLNHSTLPQHLHLLQPRHDRPVQLAHPLQQGICLQDLIRGFIQPALRGLDAAVTVVDELLQVAKVLMLELRFVGICVWIGGICGAAGGRAVVVGFERLGVDFGTWAKVEFSVGEEVVRAGTHDEGFADTGVRNGQVGGGRGVCVAHKLLEELTL